MIHAYNLRLCMHIIVSTYTCTFAVHVHDIQMYTYKYRRVAPSWYTRRVAGEKFSRK